MFRLVSPKKPNMIMEKTEDLPRSGALQKAEQQA